MSSDKIRIEERKLNISANKILMELRYHNLATTITLKGLYLNLGRDWKHTDLR